MKISAFGITAIALGKHNVKDLKLDQADKLVKAKKKTYPQIELISGELAIDADVIILSQDAKMDLILKDLEFMETRLAKNPPAAEKIILEKMKAALEKEEFISVLGLTAAEKEVISGYGLFTLKPVVVIKNEELEDFGALLARVDLISGLVA